jgi:hypothetical protein
MNTGGNLNGGDPLKKGVESVTNNSFVQHVTRFDTETRSELTNLIQYLVIAIVPIYFLNRTLNDMIPKFDEKKGNIEVLGEVVIQSISLLLGIYLIHRVICYIPTFSGDNLPEINFLNIVLVIVFMGMNSDNGKKVNMVYERIFESKKENMTSTVKKSKGDGAVVKVSQPLSNGGGIRQPQPTHQASRADYLGAHEQMKEPQPNQVVQQVHNDPNVGMGGQNGNMNSMGGMGMMGGMEPMAANEGFGAFSSF